MKTEVTYLLIGLQSAIVQLLLQYSILEEEPPNTFVANLTADFGPKSSKNAQGMFLILSTYVATGSRLEECKERLFNIDSIDSVLKTRIVIDREQYCPGEDTCLFKIEILHSHLFLTHPHQVQIIAVEILDINDNFPSFDQQSIHLKIYESQRVGTKLTLPKASDSDSPSFSIHKYQLIPNFNGTFDTQRQARMTGIEGSTFAIDRQRAISKHPSLYREEALFLILKANLDREATSIYHTVLWAADGGLPSQSSGLEITIEVLDVNDNSPSFKEYTYYFYAREDTTPGGVIGQVEAVDEDEGQNALIAYQILDPDNKQSTLATIDQDSGVIKTISNLDFEISSVHTFLVQAIDAGASPLTGFAKVIIYVQDVNDNEPLIELHSIRPSENLVVPENSPAGTFVAYITVTDVDSEENGRTSCIINDNFNFHLKQIDQDRYQLLTRSSFDAELESFRTISLFCHDHGEPQLHSRRDLKISILDINDCVPEVHPNDRNLSIFFVEHNEVGVEVKTIRAFDCDASKINSELKFSLEDITHPPSNTTPKLRIDVSNGTISTNAVLTYGSKNQYLFRVIVFDTGTPQLNTSTFFRLSIIKARKKIPECRLQTFRVLENIQPPFEIGTISRPEDCATCHYHFEVVHENLIRSNHIEQLFNIDTITGTLVCMLQLDREMQSEYLFDVSVTSLGHRNIKVKVRITVEDVNDNAPIFVNFPTTPVVLFQPSQKVADGEEFILICFHAMDEDEGINSEVSFDASVSRADSTFRSIFHFVQVNSSSCCLSLADSWPNGTKLYTVFVTLRDHGSPSLSNSAFLKVILFTPAAIIKQQPDLAKEKLNSFQVVLPWSLAAVLIVLVITMVTSVSFRNRKQTTDNKRNEEICRIKQIQALTECDSTKHPIAVRTISPDVIPETA